MMKEMREALRGQGGATDFCLVSEPLRRYAAEDAAWIKTKGLPYEEFLQHTIQSDIVVEVVQSRQVGITVRALEAMFYHKKLITNNAAISKTPMYHPCNVLIWDPGAQEKLPAFLQAAYQPLPEAVEKRYTFAAWLDNFLQPGAAD